MAWHMRVQRYLDERILKTTITSKVSSNNDTKVTTNDDDYVYILPDKTNVVAKVVAVDLK